ncbi:hypothetical protein T08_7133 [Trichinella sp. T8]|nr:hypothetical protein T08_7133 [Trichinella sp. T8]
MKGDIAFCLDNLSSTFLLCKKVHGCGGYVYGTTVPPLLFPTNSLLLGLQASRSTSSTLEPAVPIRVCDFDRRWIVHSDPPSVVRTIRTAYMWSKSNVRYGSWLKVITICDPVLDVL